MNVQHLNHHRGFTLIEILLYLALSTVLVIVISTVSIAVLRAAKKTELMQDVTYASMYIFKTLDQVAAISYVVEEPAMLATSSSLTLSTYDDVHDSITVSYIGDVLHITRGDGSPLAIQPSNIETQVVFTGLSSTTVGVQLVVAASSTSMLSSAQVSETFETTLTLFTP